MRYKDAGVDIEKTDRLINKIKKYSDQIGSFAGRFSTNAWDSNDFAASCDGVGTKIIMAKEAKKRFNRPLTSIGQDLVAMVTNDLLCQSAKPLIFMDYYASNRINESDYLEVLEGVYNACEECDTKLIGGETAEMPKTFNQDIFDIAGFGIGNIIKYNEDEDNTIKPNDIVMGLLSSGFHSNGFSLIRKHMKKFDEELFYNFLEPTKLYYKPLNKIREKKIHIKGIAHITGGGFDNIKRIIPKSFDVEWELNEDFYNKSYLFQLIKTLTHSTHHEMRKTFNCGIGMMLVCPENMLKYFSNQEAIYLGKIIKKIP